MSRPDCKAAGVALLLAIVLHGSLARAGLETIDTMVESEKYASPERFMLELKFGPYTPAIDSELDTATPYRDIFGDGTNLMFKTELDVNLWRGFGTIAIGAQLGYFGNSAKALEDTGSDSTPSDATDRTAGDTSISLMPTALLAIYRFDVLARRYHVPLVPYAKVGINYTFWWITKGDGSTASYAGEKAAGGTFGWQFNVGAAFLLDVLEPQAAKTLDVEIGINHTYLFFELDYIRADGFGSSKALHVGDITWNAGIAFAF